MKIQGRTVEVKSLVRSKGKDARQGKRTANVICCSNPDESRLTKFDWGDRRYSIVRIAETPLTSRLPNDYTDVEAYVEDLLEPSNIAQLGTYLRYHHTTNTDVTKNFRSEAYAKELEDDQKPDWVIDLEAWAIRNPGSQELYDNVRDNIWLHTTKKPGKKTATRKTKDNPYVKCYKTHDNTYVVKSLVDGTPQFGEATWSP